MAQNPATLRGADTVQVHQEVEPLVGGMAVFPITFYDTLGSAPEWQQADRDGYLRDFWRDFGNDMLQAVLAVSVAKIETQNWELEGPEALAEMYHDIIRDEADFGNGYGTMVARGVIDYYTQDNGWFLERLRSGPGDHDGPMLGVAHLDSARMRPTGNADFPWTYMDVHGEYHLMHRSQLIRIVDMPDPATTLYSPQRGFCALSRALSTAMILTMLVTLKREKLADLPPSALAVFNNINRKQFEKALSLHGAKADQVGNTVWRQLLPLFGIDPAHPASVSFISLREVWEGFDDMTAMNIAAYSFAAAWRIDPREFWPVSQGPLGTGKEAEVQHQKAKSKSTGLLYTEIERAFNHKLSLPKGVSFKYKMQDIDEEEQQATIHKTQIDNVRVMQEAGATLTAEEVRYLFAVQYKIIPQTMAAVPVEGATSSLAHTDVVMDDVERQAKAYGGWYFGRRVKIDSYGVKEYTDFVGVAMTQAFKEMLPSDVFYVGDKGGAGSGNWGHAGRPGMIGGSAPMSGTGAAMSIRTGKTAVRRQEEARKPGLSEYGAMTGEGASIRPVTGAVALEYGWSKVIRLDTIDYDDRSQIKQEVTADLAKRTGLPEEQANLYVAQWADTANDNDIGALSFQQAAAEEFGVELSDWQKGIIKAATAPDPFSIARGYVDEPLMSREDERVLVRAAYEATQEWLLPFSGGDPDRTVRLYRGVALPQKPGDIGEVVSYTGNAMESWSVLPDVARSFSRDYAGAPDVGVVISANVPIKNIVSTARTGPGCMNEGEMLILGTLPGSTVSVESVFVPTEDYLPEV